MCATVHNAVVCVELCCIGDPHMCILLGSVGPNGTVPLQFDDRQ